MAKSREQVKRVASKRRGQVKKGNGEGMSNPLSEGDDSCAARWEFVLDARSRRVWDPKPNA